jgi:hypothetical protein
MKQSQRAREAKRETEGAREKRKIISSVSRCADACQLDVGCKSNLYRMQRTSLTSVCTICVALLMNCSLVCRDTQMFSSLRDGTL